MVTQDPYALKNLLPVGTVLLHFEPEVSSIQEPVGHWDTLRSFLDGHGFRLAASSQSRLQELEFLGLHQFVRTTWNILAGVQLRLLVRVYLIPFDLAGVGGSLMTRNRGELKVLAPARKALTSLLTNTNRSARAWFGHAAPGDIFEPFISSEHDVRTLSEIYGCLPSPTIDVSTFLSGADHRTQKALKNALHWEAPPGMRPLYGYQRRTVARMLQQELDPGLAPDPLYIPIHDIHNVMTYYMQPSTMEVLSECPLRSQARGGILCEEMGTGKTCIVLGLIMATRHQLSVPEQEPWNAPERPVLTPLALQHFPQARFGHSRSAACVETPRPPLPSLVDTLTHFIRASPECIGPPGYDTRIQDGCPHLWESLARNQPFYHVYDHVSETTSARRKGVSRGFRLVYLTSATLVVVPQAILAQWNAEINKHCGDGSLRVIRLDSGDQALSMPSAYELASNYDIVLMSHQRFAAEKPRCNPSSLHSWKLCTCRSSPGCLLCKCPTPPSVSPLIQIRWKRLVVDEGHVSATQSNLAKLAQELNVERRWIVSGTPTRNLMGLSLGQSGHSIESHDGDDDDDDDGNTFSVDHHHGAYSGGLVYPRDVPDDADPSGFSLTLQEVSMGGQNGSRLRGRRWAHVDRDDLYKLGDMIVKFIGVPQFVQEIDLFRKRVSAPLLGPGGPCFGAIQVVSQVMAQVMIRHQIRDVEQELPEKLPELKEKTVVLKFQPLAAKSYNLLQSLIAVNAADTERTGLDYFFHPRNRASLREVLQNLTQTMFFRSCSDFGNINEVITRSEEALQKALDRNSPESDVTLLKGAIRVQCDAAQDLLWDEVNRREDIFFVVRGLSRSLQAAWLKLDANLFENETALMDPDRICKLRHILVHSPSVSERRLMEHGLGVTAEDARNAALYEEYLQSRKRKRRLDDDVNSLKLKQANAKAGSKEKLEELSEELTAAINRKERRVAENSRSVLIEPSLNAVTSSPSWISLSVGNSPSSKINYILRKVLKHAAKHKFLIFSASPLSLAYVAEALQVAQVPHLQYTSGVTSRIRQQTVVTFETSDKYRILLMELKLGARGLNLVTASRIIFCEPVWQADVESQAIKRAHRIGQKGGQIKVATLVMQGTSEEAMVTRRRALQRKSQRLPAMEEDAGMRVFLQNPTFLSVENIEPSDAPGLDIRLVPGVALGQREDPMSTANDRREIVDISAPRSKVDFASPPDSPRKDHSPAKKTKLVHFG